MRLAKIRALRTSLGWIERLSNGFSENRRTKMTWESHSGTMEFQHSRQDGSRVSGDRRPHWMRPRLALEPNERENSRGRPQPGLRIMLVMTTVASSRSHSSVLAQFSVFKGRIRELRSSHVFGVILSHGSFLDQHPIHKCLSSVLKR
jgi:hypothetical protein